MKTIEQQLQESQAQVATLTADNARLQEAVKVAAKNTAAATLTTLLTEAKLPKPAEDRLRKQFADAVEVAGMQEAIDAEKAYIVALTPAPATTTAKKNNGAAANGTTEESDRSKPTVNLVESYKLLGMTEAQAKIAAGAK